MSSAHAAHPQLTRQAIHYAEQALAAMLELGIAPTPRNYSIFYAVAAGEPKELLQELDTLRARKTPFSEEVLDALHHNYIADAQARSVQQTTAAARKILSEMLQSVSQFAGTTNAAGHAIAEKLASFNPPTSEDVMRVLAQTIIEQAGKLTDSSDVLTLQLAGAQREILDLRANLARAVTEAEHDFLTGSYNRKAFDARLLEAVDEANTQHTDLSLLMVDIDHFKAFNDNYGHLIGDEVIKIVAKALMDSLKGTDTVARYGGEEFAIILPRTPLAGGVVVAEAIRKLIASKELKHKGTGETFGGITVSVGASALHAGETSPIQLTERADRALYRAKSSGRNRVIDENQ